MKKIASLSLIAIAALAGENISVVPFAGYLDYGSKSVKDNGYFGGVYVSKEFDLQKVELQYEYLKVKYKNDEPDLEQNDFTAVYTNYFDDNYLARAGLHFIDSDDYLTDGGYILFGGLKYFQAFDFDAGIDVFYTHYDNFDPSLGVWQFSPSFGKYIKGCSYGDFYVEGKYNYITFKSSKITQTVVNQSSGMSAMGKKSTHIIQRSEEYTDSYNSFEFNLANYYGKFTTKASVWIGKQAFGVRDGGFTVYNLAEIHKGGAALQTRYSYSKELGLSAGIYYEKFTDTENGEDSYMTTLGASLDYRF
ncbi:hypothetical protein [Nitrosophilus alvini]|uniref:hypothetical protein n=1 Tax=Nitrosophilus alvini TaxID=2714855 RepID=UPI00190D823A|nr:hypothetical protein [Nitrosophilus alvini]